jgi:hypothetical protein
MPRTETANLRGMLALAALTLVAGAGRMAGCSRQPAPSPITPPAAWGPVIDDKTDEWSGAMVGSTQEVVDSFISQYQEFSTTTQVEEQSAHHVVLRFDYADLVRGMARSAGTEPPPPGGKPLDRRLLVEVKPSGKDFDVRLRSFNVDD